jgi:predicted kinase
MLIVMAGLPGTGKSELAAQLARRLRVPVFSVDPIEAAIISSGIGKSFETGLAAYRVVEALADAQLKLGLDAIVDAVNAEEPAKQMWRALAARYALSPKIVECRCSDESLHRERLMQRRRGLGKLFEPTWDQVQQRRLAYKPWSEPVFAVDSVLPLDSNVARTLAWLGEASSAG